MRYKPHLVRKKEIMVSIIVSAVTAFLVSYATSKRCFDKADSYVEDMTNELHKALNKLIRHCEDN